MPLIAEIAPFAIIWLLPVDSKPTLSLLMFITAAVLPTFAGYSVSRASGGRALAAAGGATISLGVSVVGSSPPERAVANVASVAFSSTTCQRHSSQS